MSDRYQLVRQVASGGMAEVYLGVARGEEGFERSVAIKQVLPHLARDPAIARMFLSEARLATHLHHQNIVQVIDVGKSTDGLFIVMELIDGWNLAEVLDVCIAGKGLMPPYLAAFVAAQVSTGLAHAYRRTHEGKPIIVAHRDVSPSNVLLSAEGEVKVADFGVARLQALSGGTEPGTFKGKIAYAAPEALGGTGASAASDQFALGVILFEMLAGRHPFGRPDALMSYMTTLRDAAPAPLQGAPAELVAITGRMLQKAPGDRYPDMDAAGRALAGYLSRSGQPAGSVELATFLRTLALPPSFAQREGAAVADDRTAFSLRGASVPSAPAGSTAGLSYQDFIDPEWGAAGPSLDVDGRLQNDKTTPEASPAPSEVPPEEESLELELAVSPVQPDAGGDPPGGPAPSQEGSSRGRTLNRALILLAVLGVLGAFGAVILWPRWNELTRETAVLFIDSEPSGAMVRVAGQDLGRTPFAQENLWGGEVEFQLVLKGYQPYLGSFKGGEAVNVVARLKR